MTLREFVSNLFHFRMKNGESGWDDMARELGKNGTFSITGSPHKFQQIFIELCKRVDKLEYEKKSA